MNKLNNTGKLIITAVVIVIAIVLVAYYGSRVPSGSPSSGTSTATGTVATGGSASAPAAGTGSTATGGTATTKSTSGASGGTTSTAKPPFVITFVTPVPNDTWTIGTYNTIRWSHEGAVSGEIDLVDATTSALVGVILPQVGPHQTYYSWNTRDIFLSRTSPLKKTVVPGRYRIRVSWDGNNLPPITSQPITITL